jgi:hypothetical protein
MSELWRLFLAESRITPPACRTKSNMKTALHGWQSSRSTIKYIHHKDNSILFQLFGVGFATLLPHARESRDPVCEHIFQYHFRNFRENMSYRKG